MKKVTLSFTIAFMMLSCQEESIKNNEENLTNNDEQSLANSFYGKTANSNCHFEYEGANGPDNWSGICGNDWQDCGGHSQSPINIQTRNVIENDDLDDLEFNYSNSFTKIINNGHTIQFDYSSGSTLAVNNKTYELKQFHFHTSSEHTVNGISYPMEVHLVHRDNTTGLLAVVGVFFELSNNDNPLLANFMNDLPLNEGDIYNSNFNYNALGFLDYEDEIEEYYNYSGSLTTPPCSPIVSWFVVKNRVKISRKQLLQFEALMHQNNRPVQLLNGRNIFAPES